MLARAFSDLCQSTDGVLPMAESRTRPLPPSLNTEKSELSLYFGLDRQRVDYFPHLPPYSNPTTGFLSTLPASWVPYAQLMRLDRPAGIYSIYFPCLIGLVYASCIAPVTPPPIQLVRLACILLPMCTVFRGAACTWNDNVDQVFDRQVERCRHRPIARGAVSTAQGHAFTLVQLVIGFSFMTMLPSSSLPHMVIMVGLFFVYALMKRVTHFPQVFLGFSFGWTVFFSISLLGMNPFDAHLRSSLSLCGALALWTVVYDTIYATQDLRDDEAAGVKGMAVFFKDTTKHLACALTVTQVALLTLCGLWSEFGMLYYVGTVGGVACTMSCFVYLVDLSSPQSCGFWFRLQFWIVGAGFLAGFAAQYLLRLGVYQADCMRLVV